MKGKPDPLGTARCAYCDRPCASEHMIELTNTELVFGKAQTVYVCSYPALVIYVENEPVSQMCVEKAEADGYAVSRYPHYI